MKTLRVVVDRLEGDILVLIADEAEEQFLVPAGRFPLAVNDVADITVGGDGTVLSVKCLPQERDRRLAKNRALLDQLFRDN